MMHVISVVSDLEIGGAQKLQVIFARTAVERGIKVTLVSFGPDNHGPVSRELHEMDIPLVCFPAGKLFDLKRLAGLIRLFRQARPDFVHTHLQYPNIIASIAARLVNIPVVSTLHSSNIQNEYYHPARFWVEKMCLRHLVSRVIAVGESVKASYQPHLKNKTVIVLPNPVHSPQCGQLIEKKALLRGGRRLAIAVGRLAAPKGYGDLIKAFAIVVREIRDVRLLIVGDGELKEEISCQIKEHGMEEFITLLGSRGDVPELLSISDLFICASHWEGLPLAVLEAMAAGLPVIATHTGDIPLVVKEGSGLLVPPKEPEALAKAIISLCQNPQQMQEMGAAGKKFVFANHSTTRWMDQLLGVYQQALEENASKHVRQRTDETRERMHEGKREK